MCRCYLYDRKRLTDLGRCGWEILKTYFTSCSRHNDALPGAVIAIQTFGVASFMALYGEMKLGWTRARADAHARTLWRLNATWAAFLETGRAELLDGEPT